MSTNAGIKKQIDLVANWIMANCSEEIGDGGACDVAVRLLEKYHTALTKIMSELGIPGKGYLMPVANAWEFAKDALTPSPKPHEFTDETIERCNLWLQLNQDGLCYNCERDDELASLKTEVKRLRGIEAAVRGHDDEAPLEVIIASWRHLALQMRSDGMSAWPLILEGIADELKVK